MIAYSFVFPYETELAIKTEKQTENELLYMECDIDRANAVESYSLTKKNFDNRTSSHSFDRRHVIGYIIGYTLVVSEPDKEKELVMEKLQDNMFYEFAHSGVQVVEYFKKNITKGYNTRQEADIASYIAHNPITFND